MNRRMLKRAKGAGGQAMVETAIVFPTLVFTILGIIQLTLVQQARMMLEYAAFSAARTGAVWNAEPARMQKAAVLALMPTMPSPPIEGILPNPLCPSMRVDEPLLLLCRWAWTAGWNNTTSFLFNGKPLIGVETLSPVKEDFNGEKEIDFDQGGDSLSVRKRSQLTIRVTYFYELRIPIINWVFFESWLAAMGGVGLRGLDPFEPKIATKYGEIEVSDATMRMGYELYETSGKTNCAYSGLTRTHLGYLLGLGSVLHKWYLPLITTYTIRMQSNLFVDNAPKKPQKCK